MKWRKSPEELVATFESVMPGALAVMRKMFGFPADFIQGNMFMGLHEENMILGLLENPRTELLVGAFFAVRGDLVQLERLLLRQLALNRHRLCQNCFA